MNRIECSEIISQNIQVFKQEGLSGDDNTKAIEGVATRHPFICLGARKPIYMVSNSSETDQSPQL